MADIDTNAENELIRLLDAFNDRREVQPGLVFENEWALDLPPDFFTNLYTGGNNAPDPLLIEAANMTPAQEADLRRELEAQGFDLSVFDRQKEALHQVQHNSRRTLLDNIGRVLGLGQGPG